MYHSAFYWGNSVRLVVTTKLESSKTVLLLYYSRNIKAKLGTWVGANTHDSEIQGGLGRLSQGTAAQCVPD